LAPAASNAENAKDANSKSTVIISITNNAPEAASHIQIGIV
jgi:hypothetical protein